MPMSWPTQKDMPISVAIHLTVTVGTTKMLIVIKFQLSQPKPDAIGKPVSRGRPPLAIPASTHDGDQFNKYAPAPCLVEHV